VAAAAAAAGRTDESQYFNNYSGMTAGVPSRKENRRKPRGSIVAAELAEIKNS
jgi:hypothetical protein